MSPQFLLIFLCLLLGASLRLSGRFPTTAPQSFNSFVIWVSMPALVLLQVPELLRKTPLNLDILVPVSMAWIVFGLSYVVFSRLGKSLGWSRQETGALILTCGLANTAFVGFPILESLLGPESLPIGVLVDQPGTFLVLSSFGLVVTASHGSSKGRDVSTRALVKNVVTFPPFVALVVAVVWHFSGLGEPHAVRVVLERLAITLVPLALVAVGFQLKVSREVLMRRFRPLALGLGFRLVLAPLFFTVLYVIVFRSTEFSTRVTLLEAAMAPMITAAVVSDEFGLDTELANLMVGIGIPLSLFTVPLWNRLPWIAALPGAP